MSKKITDLNAADARIFLLKPQNYVTFELPFYIDFSNILKVSETILQGQDISTLYPPEVIKNPKNKKLTPNLIDDVNYVIINNKDGRHAWRPFSIIHPILYVHLVNLITQNAAWQEIQNLFSKSSACSHIECSSIPTIPNSKNTQKKTQILNWWENFEQKSLQLSLEFSTLLKTDIADCYNSIYTHSISWAFQGRQSAKIERRKKNRKKSLGDQIDQIIESMQCGQTKGIPQGSVLMDFVAEMILASIDIDLETKLQNIGDYKILRYRDDYRIFTNEVGLAELILKELGEILMTYGLSLNSKKTKLANDLIADSLKEEKLDFLNSSLNLQLLRFEDSFRDKNNVRKNEQKLLMSIYSYTKNFSNSGQLKRILKDFYAYLPKKKELSQAYAMLGIIVAIAYHNPTVYPHCAAIISKIINGLPETEQEKAIDSVLSKLKNLPNTGFLDIWMQRVSYKLKPTQTFPSNICKLIKGDPSISSIWNNDWLEPTTKSQFESCKIINYTQLSNMGTLITQKEVDLFSNDNTYANT